MHPEYKALEDTVAVLNRLAPRSAGMARIALGLPADIRDATAGQRLIGRIQAQAHQHCRHAVGDRYYADHPCLPQALNILFEAITDVRAPAQVIALVQAKLAYILAIRTVFQETS